MFGPTLRGSLLTVFLVPLISACASLQTDDFSQRLDSGCDTVDQCEALLQEATQRANDCRGSSLSLGCGSADKDLGTATRMLRESQRQQQRQVLRERRTKNEAQRKEWLTEKERQKEAEERRRQEHIRRRDAARAERRAEQERRDQHLEHLKQIAREPEYGIPIANFDICKARAELSELQARLAEERKLEQRSGYAVPLVRRQIAKQMIAAEDRIQLLTEQLRSRFQVAPSGCGEEYKRLVECVEARDRGCEEPMGTVVDILLSGAAEPLTP